MHNCPNCGTSLSKYEDFTHGNVTVARTGEIIFNGQRVPVTPTSRFVVDALIRAEGRVLSRNVLLDIVGVSVSSGHGAEPSENIRAIDVYVKRAREAFEKLDPSFDQIVAVRGMGYRWDAKRAAALRLAA